MTYFPIFDQIESLNFPSKSWRYFQMNLFLKENYDYFDILSNNWQYIFWCNLVLIWILDDSTSLVQSKGQKVILLESDSLKYVKDM